VDQLGGIVLTGGGAVRLDGADKAAIELAGRTLLERALDALVDAREVVVVGEDVRTNRPVTFRREDPTGGGPAAGLLAGLDGFPRLPLHVAVLAVDMPLVTPATFRRLADALTRPAAAGSKIDGAVLVDEHRRRQPLCAVYDVSALRAARPAPGEEHGLSMRALLEPLRLVEVPTVGDEARDVDTWEDVRELRERLDDERARG
jgi:molybdopterin-guanine dinucleotide biosynthesis protein A